MRKVEAAGCLRVFLASFDGGQPGAAVVIGGECGLCGKEDISWRSLLNTASMSMPLTF